MKHKAFTLIEMVLVIVVVGILMSMVMSFGGRFIRDIEARQLREEWVSDFTMIRGRLLLSREYNGTSVDNLTLGFDHNTMTQTIVDDSEDETGATSTISYQGIKTITGPNIKIRPYALACKITNDTEASNNTIKLTFENSTKEYCYTIDQATCKVRRTECHTEEN